MKLNFRSIKKIILGVTAVAMLGATFLIKPQRDGLGMAHDKEFRFESPMDVEVVYNDSHQRGLISFYLIGHKAIQRTTKKGELIKYTGFWVKGQDQFTGGKLWPETVNKALYAITVDVLEHYDHNVLLEARDVIPAGEKTDYLEMNFTLTDGTKTTVIYSFVEAQEIDVRLVCPREAVSGEAVWLGTDLEEHTNTITINMVDVE